MTAVSYHGTVNDLQGLSFVGRVENLQPLELVVLEESRAKECVAHAHRGDGSLE